LGNYETWDTVDKVDTTITIIQKITYKIIISLIFHPIHLMACHTILDAIYYDIVAFDEVLMFAMAESDVGLASTVPSQPSVTPRSYFPATWLFNNFSAGY